MKFPFTTLAHFIGLRRICICAFLYGAVVLTAGCAEPARGITIVKNEVVINERSEIHPMMISEERIPPARQNNWLSLTDPNDVIYGLFDLEGNLWTAGRGGIVQWNVAENTYSRYTVVNGLPENYISALGMAKNGTLWAGTSSGYVAYFDGTFWVNPDKKIGDTITTIVADDSNGVWFGTNAGAVYYDGNSWSTFNKKNGLIDNFVHSIAFTPEMIWFGTSNGVSEMDLDSHQITQIPTPVGSVVFNIVVGDQNDVWLGSNTGLYKVDRSNKRIGYRYDFAEAIRIYRNRMVRDLQGNLWIGADSAIIKFDGNVFSRYETQNAGKITSLIVSPTRELWYGTSYDGIARFDNGIVDCYRIPGQLTGNFILSVTEDSDGNVWVSSDQGLSTVAMDLRVALKSGPGEERIPLTKSLSSSSAAILVGYEDNLVYFTGASSEKLAAPPELNIEQIQYALLDPQEIIWTIADNNVYKVNNEFWTPIVLYDIPQENRFFLISSDKSGIIWLIGSKALIRYDQGEFFPIIFPDIVISSFSLRDNGEAWIGTDRNGAISITSDLWDRVNPHIVDFLTIYANGAVSSSTSGISTNLDQGYIGILSNEKLLNERITGIAFQSKDSIWIGANNGIYQFVEGNWLEFTTNNGLSSNQVWSVIIDDENVIWAGTSNGLSRYTVETP